MRRHLIRTRDGRVGLDMLAMLDEERSEVDLERFRPGDVLVVDTANTTYVFEKCEGKQKWRIGTTNPDRVKLIPANDDPVEIHGCTFGGTMLKVDAVFVGGHLEFSHPDTGTTTTSQVKRVRAKQQLPDGDSSGDEAEAPRREDADR